MTIHYDKADDRVASNDQVADSEAKETFLRIGTEIFFIYAHTDKELRDKLEKHLSPLQRQGVITGWHDWMISPGTEWKGKIDTHLSTAAIILLLVSPDFMASNYCYDIEMKRAMERHEAGEARVIPVIVRPVIWKIAPFDKLQVLPSNGKVVTSWRNRDEAFLDVAQGIWKAVDDLQLAKHSVSISRGE